MAVTNFEIEHTLPYADGREFGDTGSFRQIDGVLHFAVDPEHEANRCIVDLALAPRDQDGLVRFSADFSVVTPVDAERGNRRALVELPNRGRRRLVPVLNRAPSDAPVAREAHPGEKAKQATSIDEKIEYAKRNRDDYKEERKIIVDNVEGKWHHEWGLLPNTVYVINPEGKVMYRAGDGDMLVGVDLIAVLQNPVDIVREGPVGAAPWITIPVTLKGGWVALYDILIIFPKVYYEHFKLDIKTWWAKRKARKQAV